MLSKILFSKVRWIVLTIISFTLVLCLSAVSFSQAQSVQSADQLNQAATSLLQQGAAAEALDTWRSATELYEAEGNVEGVKGSQINQALAMQVIGLHARACLTLVDVLELPSNVCLSGRERQESSLNSVLLGLNSDEVNRIGLRLLGETLRLLGNASSAETVLTFAQQGQWPQNSPEEARISLALGTVHQLLAQEAMQTLNRIGARDIQLQTEAIAQINSQTNQAIEQYQLALTDSTALATKTRLNLIDLYVDFSSKLVGLTNRKKSALTSVEERLNLVAERAYTELKPADFDQLSAIESIYARLNLAENLLALAQIAPNSRTERSTDLPMVKSLVDRASAQAEMIGDSRALSFALGLNAEVKKRGGVPASDIATVYRQALSLAQSVQADDAAYQFAYELAQFDEAQGAVDSARQEYQMAIASLAQVREDLIAVNSDLRFNFREKIEPVYRDYIRLVVANATPDFAEAVAVYESLQRAEIENFLRCGRLLPASRTEDLDAVTFYLMNLGESVEVVTFHSGSYYGYSVPASEILKTAENLIANVQSSSFLATPEEEFLPYAQQMYNALLKPAEEAGILFDSQRLNFVLDAPFQSIPMGIIHDGSQYLVETHTISNALRLQRSEPALSDRSRALFAGLIEVGPSADDPRVPDSFGALPETEFEAIAIQDTLRSETLLDSAFTAERFADEVATGNYQTVHISTHGQFSSVPEQTFLVAWDELIDIQDMARTFQGAGNIDLLVLSACQTAAGDERSVLGLAGVAIQSGARSAIASLWLVDTIGSSVLMEQFYEGIGQGLNQAEALQQAQVTLLNSTSFSHPFYWAPFVLVGG